MLQGERASRHAAIPTTPPCGAAAIHHGGAASIHRRAARALLSLLLAAGLGAQTPPAPPPHGDPEVRIKALESRLDALSWRLDELVKAVDDNHWFQRLSDIAEVDKVTYVGPPNPKDEETYGVRNERHPLKVKQYVFVPRKLDRGRKHPLIILPHGGVHGDFGTYHVHIIREMLERGYVVIAPEYRGSTGYGKGFYQAVDYGGLEVDDVVAGRDWAVEQMAFVDPGRCAIVGWSHGGYIALMAAFQHPEKFKAIYAGVPVSNLLIRLGSQDDEYRAEFAAPYHLGKAPVQDVELYRRRSPVYNVEKLRTPLLIHATTNDRDVGISEVEHLIQALKAAGKDFQYRIYQDAPGGHSFNRIDTAYAKASRKELYDWLAKQLGGGR